jgi:hypothetical protein
MKKPILCALAAVGLIAVTSTAHAGPMICPVGASTDMGQSFPLVNSYNQTGLTATYTCGVTDFDVFVPATQHASNPGADWVAVGVTGLVTWDLGGVYALDQMAVWNFGSGSGNPAYATNRIQLWTSADGIVYTSRGSFGLVNPNGAPLATAQLLPISSSAQYVRMEILSNYGGPASALGEVAFGVPEPGTLLLLGTGLAAIGRRSRRRQA